MNYGFGDVVFVNNKPQRILAFKQKENGMVLDLCSVDSNGDASMNSTVLTNVPANNVTL